MADINHHWMLTKTISLNKYQKTVNGSMDICRFAHLEISICTSIEIQPFYKMWFDDVYSWCKCIKKCQTFWTMLRIAEWTFITAVLSYLQQLVNAMYSLFLDNVSLPQSSQCLESGFLGGRWLPSINFSIIPPPKWCWREYRYFEVGRK